MKYFIIVFLLLSEFSNAQDKTACEQKVESKVGEFLKMEGIKPKSDFSEININEELAAYSESKQKLDAANEEILNTIAVIRSNECGLKQYSEDLPLRERIDCGDSEKVIALLRARPELEKNYSKYFPIKKQEAKIQESILEKICKKEESFCDGNGLLSYELINRLNRNKKSQYSVRRYNYKASRSDELDHVRILYVDNKPVRFYIGDKFRITLDDDCEPKETIQLAMQIDAYKCKRTEEKELIKVCTILGFPTGRPTPPASGTNLNRNTNK